MKKSIFLNLVVLSLVSVMLSSCTTSSESQLKESLCKQCRDRPEFYRNGLWLEEQSRD